MRFVNKKWIILALMLFSLPLISCGDPIEHGEDVDVNLILSDIASLVILTTYKDLADKARDLEDAIYILASDATVENLQQAQETWKAARKPWEQSEGFLFGSVDTEGIDPSLDKDMLNLTGAYRGS